MMKEKHPWQVETQMVLPQTKRTIKNTLVVQNSVLSDSNKRLLARGLLLF